MTAMFLKGMKQTKRLVMAVIGFTVLTSGGAMIVLPGPAIIVIPIGLGILAAEFMWARNLLKKVKMKFRKTEEGGENA